MGSYPTSPRSDFLAWCQAHVDVFNDAGPSIGLSAAQALAFKNAVSGAADAAGEQESARLTYSAATDLATDRFGELRRSASEMVRTIKTFAENSGNPDVYARAQIPPPATPGTTPPPAKPSDLTVALEPGTGAILLRWKAANPTGTSGTSYVVRRRTSVNAEFEFVGISGEKRFTDNTFVAGPDSVQYTVQGHRSDRAGLVSDVFTVTFGRNGPGVTVTATGSDEQTNPQRAAA